MFEWDQSPTNGSIITVQNDTDLMKILSKPCIALNGSEVSSSNCRNDSTMILKHYKLISTKMTWPNAKDNCENIGGRLYDNFNEIGQLVADFSLSTNNWEFWIGVSSSAKSDTWITTLGTDVTDNARQLFNDPDSWRQVDRCIKYDAENQIWSISRPQPNEYSESVCTLVDGLDS